MIPDEFRIASVAVEAYTVPTSTPEQDGTLDWDSTTIVLVRPRTASGTVGLGYTYAHACLVPLIESLLTPILIDRDVRDPESIWQSMTGTIRNLGRTGLVAMALSAVDTALWDLKARCFEQPLHRVLDAEHTAVPIYGSGGFTNYSLPELTEQLTGWVGAGMSMVKMKIGRLSLHAELDRIALIREAIGPDVELFVDADGAYDRHTAARIGAELPGVTWFEEPVSTHDHGGLAWLAEGLPLDITAGEYAFQLPEFADLQSCVDVLQIDLTRCGGITEWQRIVAQTTEVQLSAHGAPALTLPVALATGNLRHMEGYHDHLRLESMLFGGLPQLIDGALTPTGEPGNGLHVKVIDAEPYRVR
ncbi:mandelate racemase [Pseudonocardiaceae bacterium YIM PH 21723]|nr:mandelate racemase [Pseudonocardiaceae bacterium YIM PH 21723]